MMVDLRLGFLVVYLILLIPIFVYFFLVFVWCFLILECDAFFMQHFQFLISKFQFLLKFFHFFCIHWPFLNSNILLKHPQTKINLPWLVKSSQRSKIRDPFNKRFLLTRSKILWENGSIYLIPYRFGYTWQRTKLRDDFIPDFKTFWYAFSWWTFWMFIEYFAKSDIQD